MKIQAIEITNYKAFLNTHKISVGGKNIFIYGENGSGKSSLYYALKDFFQSSVEDISLADLENVFVTPEEKGKTSIEVTFKPNPLSKKSSKSYIWNAAKNDAQKVDDTSIRDGNSLKSFLTYKHLLSIHYLKKGETINLFDLLVKGVLKHFKYSLTNGKELGQLWAEAEEAIAKPISREYLIAKKRVEVNAAVKIFNKAFGELFSQESPEYILKHAKPFLDRFNHNIDLNLSFPQVRPNKDHLAFEGAKVRVELSYAGKRIDKPHLFLNEARLSAIAISIYLGMIRRHVQGIPCKVLFLDDIFIGLDIGNRLPLLEILETEFPDYQIFITTYDKPWFEYARGFLDQKVWKTMEFYAKKSKDGIESPIVFDGQDLITKAEYHLQQCDYKSSAIYTRSAFEKLIRKYCENEKKLVIFKSRLKDYSTEDFWKVIKDELPKEISESIENYRSLVLNQFSHYNTEQHEIKAELEKAIQAVKNLKLELEK